MKLYTNKKVLLREHKRHTACSVPSFTFLSVEGVTLSCPVQGYSLSMRILVQGEWCINPSRNILTRRNQTISFAFNLLIQEMIQHAPFVSFSSRVCTTHCCKMPRNTENFTGKSDILNISQRNKKQIQFFWLHRVNATPVF